MRILLVADGRSPITRQWIKGLLSLQHEVILISTFPCSPVEGVMAQDIIPVAFAGLSGSQVEQVGGRKKSGGVKKAVAGSRSSFLKFRYWLGPLTLPFYRQHFKEIVQGIHPDLVHALRIPFEGMLASYTPPEIPLAVSIWGNDLTLHGVGSKWMQNWTERTLLRADGLASDTFRDLRLAKQWGFAGSLPTLAVPGNGGIDLAEMGRTGNELPSLDNLEIPPDSPLVINPRGFRPGSVRNDVFFQAVSLVLQKKPDIHFVCPAMQHQEEALNWVSRYHLEKNVHLLPYLPQPELWNLFKKSVISVSISVHDGTPNTLLEAMACGCFPIVGDIESLREWIVPGRNGFLVEPGKPQALAEALLTALSQPRLRQEAAKINQQIIRNRAEINLVRAQVAVFYQRLVK